MKQAEQLLTKLSIGATSVDSANALLAESYSVISDLLELIPDDRTEKQSSSRWLYLEALANELNERGIDQVRLLKTLKKAPSVDIPNSKESIYKSYWTPIRLAMIEAGRIRDVKRPSKAEISQIYEVMNKHTIDNFSIGLPWPDRFNRGM